MLLDRGVAAVAFVGQHARANREAAVMAHSYSSLGIQKILVNGSEAGEIETRAALAGSFGVPVILLSGDRAAAKRPARHCAAGGSGGCEGGARLLFLRLAVGGSLADADQREGSRGLAETGAGQTLSRRGNRSRSWWNSPTRSTPAPNAVLPPRRGPRRTADAALSWRELPRRLDALQRPLSAACRNTAVTGGLQRER